MGWSGGGGKGLGCGCGDDTGSKGAVSGTGEGNREDAAFGSPQSEIDGPGRRGSWRLFCFLHFSKKNLQKYIFNSGFTVLYPCRPAGGRQGAYRPAGGR